MRIFYGFILIIIIQSVVFGQNLKTENNTQNIPDDTCIMIGHYILDQSKLYINRDTLLENIELKTNIEGLSVASFVMTTFSLGTEKMLISDTSFLTTLMINTINGSQINYKFVNLKNIVLIDENGVKYKPTFEKIKIIFTN